MQRVSDVHMKSAIIERFIVLKMRPSLQYFDNCFIVIIACERLNNQTNDPKKQRCIILYFKQYWLSCFTDVEVLGKKIEPSHAAKLVCQLFN
jgi:hypothetical protein